MLEAMLYAGHGSQQGARRKAEPDWAYVHHELRRPGVTPCSTRMTIRSLSMSPILSAATSDTRKPAL